MSFHSFRRIFCPTLEERINDLKLIIRLHEESIGTCFTCEHHISSSTPGFVMDYGSCVFSDTRLLERLSNETKYVEIHLCPLYNERSIDDVREKLAKLEREVSSANNRESFEDFVLTRFGRKY